MRLFLAPHRPLTIPPSQSPLTRGSSHAWAEAVALPSGGVCLAGMVVGRTSAHPAWGLLKWGQGSKAVSGTGPAQGCPGGAGPRSFLPAFGPLNTEGRQSGCCVCVALRRVCVCGVVQARALEAIVVCLPPAVVCTLPTQQGHQQGGGGVLCKSTSVFRSSCEPQGAQVPPVSLVCRWDDEHEHPGWGCSRSFEAPERWKATEVSAGLRKSGPAVQGA